MDKQNAIDSGETQLLIVRLGNESYGIELLKIARVLNYEGIAKTGEEPEFLEGTIELEGNIVPVLDLRERLDTRGGEQGRRRIVILDFEQRRLGVIVDDFLKVLPSGSSSLERLPDDIIAAEQPSCVSGAVQTDNGVIMVISPKQILAPHEIEALHQYESQVGQVLQA